MLAEVDTHWKASFGANGQKSELGLKQEHR